jgi:hypothetical protein
MMTPSASRESTILTPTSAQVEASRYPRYMHSAYATCVEMDKNGLISLAQMNFVISHSVAATEAHRKRVK